MPSPIARCSDVRVGSVGDSPPTYDHPPLVESWLAADFVESGRRFEIDIAALRERLGPEWFGSWQSVNTDSLDDDKQLGNVMNDRAIRITTRGFAFGWLGHQGPIYPRYESIRDGFVAALDAVRDVVGRTNQELVARRWSVRYVNRVPRGTVWNNPNDWKFFRLWQPVQLPGICENASEVKCRWEIPLEKDLGTLTVKFRHEIDTTSERSDCVWITIQTKGPVLVDDVSLFDGLDFGRDIIVRAFNGLFSMEAKDFWGVSISKANSKSSIPRVTG